MFEKQSIEKKNKRDSATFLTPHSIALVQHQPELYYPKIYCPVLAVFGKMDEIVFWEENAEGMENLIKESQKENYKMMALDSINHEYRKVTDSLSMIMPPGIIQHRKEPFEPPINNLHVPDFSSIASRINEMNVYIKYHNK